MTDNVQTVSIDTVQFSIKTASDCSVILYVDTSAISILKANTIVSMLTQNLLNKRPDWCVEYIPSYDSLFIEYALFEVDHFAVNQFLRNLIELSRDQVQHIVQDTDEHQFSHATVHEVPVCYDVGEFDSDLLTLSKNKNLHKDELIALHCASRYRVFASGFLPGFAYLGELPEQLSQRRLQKPRLMVRKGAVAIADRQTAIYPEDSPGGWHILGYTPISLLQYQGDTTGTSEHGAEPLLKTGDYVQFYQISEQQYRTWSEV